MGEAIGDVFALGVGIAVSPVPIAAVILMLFSGRARSNSVSFMVAWVLGIAAVTTVGSLIPGLSTDSGDPSTATGWVKLLLGLLLMLAAARQWRSRPKSGEQAAVPGWMSKIDTLKPPAAGGLGFLLSAVNPKNLLLALAAGASIGAADLAGAQAVATIAIFTLIAALTVLVPVVGYLVAGDRLAPTLGSAKEWLIRNNATVMGVLFVVFSASLLGDAFSILAG